MREPRANVRWIDLQPYEDVYQEPDMAYWVGVGVSMGVVVTGVAGFWWWVWG